MAIVMVVGVRVRVRTGGCVVRRVVLDVVLCIACVCGGVGDGGGGGGMCEVSVDDGLSLVWPNWEVRSTRGVMLIKCGSRESRRTDQRSYVSLRVRQN